MKTNRLYHGCAAACLPVITASFLGLLMTAGPGLVNGRQPGSGIVQSSPAAQRLRQIYTSQIGVREKLSNSGPAVEEYLRYVNLPKGNPWCAAFVCWVLGKAGLENPRTGWSPGLFPVNKVIWERGSELTIDNGRLTVAKGFRPDSYRVESGKVIPQPGAGDVFGIYFQEKRRIAHVGFVDPGFAPSGQGLLKVWVSPF